MRKAAIWSVVLVLAVLTGGCGDGADVTGVAEGVSPGTQEVPSLPPPPPPPSPTDPPGPSPPTPLPREPADQNDVPPAPREVITNSIGMKLVLIPAGEFMMGSRESAESIERTFGQPAEHFEDEHPAHRVRITKPYYLGVHEVTQGQYAKVMGARPWSDGVFVKAGSHYPASYVIWEDAVEFCRKLSSQEGRRYRLPTEAEWEYA